MRRRDSYLLVDGTEQQEKGGGWVRSQGGCGGVMRTLVVDVTGEGRSDTLVGMDQGVDCPVTVIRQFGAC